MGFVVGWLCKCESKTFAIQELLLNCTSFMMTLEFCFASSKSCVLLLNPVNRNLDGVLAFFTFFNLPEE